MAEAVALEAGFCKPGNVCPKRASSFNYFEIVDDAFRIAKSCSETKGLGNKYYVALNSLKKSTLTGFVILAIPLTEAEPWEVKDLLKKTTKKDVEMFIAALKSKKLSHFKKIIANDYPTFEKALQYDSLYALFSELSRYDSMFREIICGYPNVLSTALFISECGINEACYRETQRSLLMNVLDELVIRKHGFEVMSRLREMARNNIHHIYVEEMGINPGSTADMIATSIYLILRGLHDKA